ncbi:hypothetical protein Amac_055570 [Acrocarpospora macrocephala]|uniref:Uncharacterized protein n=1 Tax=Acrocarpospora macrocephala TaxID=150177 RepID=A0A5M3WTG4_9ACTN|nr:hypothetical protein Amac_055570 [Acrocarpospora macrocephala]
MEEHQPDHDERANRVQFGPPLGLRHVSHVDVRLRHPASPVVPDKLSLGFPGALDQIQDAVSCPP